LVGLLKVTNVCGVKDRKKDSIGDELLRESARGAAAKALGTMAAQNQVDVLVDSLDDPSPVVRGAAAEALTRLGPLEWKKTPKLLETVYKERRRIVQGRFTSHYLTGGDHRTELLLHWLVLERENQPKKSSHRELRDTLDVFRQIWNSTESTPECRHDLQEQIARVAEEGKKEWTIQDLTILLLHAKILESVGSPNAAAVRNVAFSIGLYDWLQWLQRVWLLHAAFWIVLIFLYPRLPQMQAFFFWNPWIRRFAGFGYINFALTWVPFLRNRLFAPFKQSLTAEAFAQSVASERFFTELEVTDVLTDRKALIKEAIPDICGQIVLEGESGLGKTMFLREIVKSSRRTVVFLAADNCASGVLEAIQSRLEGVASDSKFLRSIIWAGGLAVIIDGLNEASVETRANIAEFVRKYTKAGILVATQPLEWRPPATARVLRLEPLAKDKIAKFLVSRNDVAEYQTRCERFIAGILREDQDPEELASIRRVLSNPMDLTTVSELLALGEEHLNLMRLQEQQYRVMASEFKRVHQRDFPLERFAEHAYKIRLAEPSLLDGESFAQELGIMEQRKMVLRRENSIAKTTLWYFRHEKIWEFFIAQYFLGPGKEQVSAYIDDPRFRGVYFLLAVLLPLDAADKLREILILHAAENKDHNVSDKFVQIIRARHAKMAKKQRGASTQQ